MRVSLIRVLCRGGLRLCDEDAMGVGWRVEAERIVAKRGREIPGQDLSMLRFGIVGKRSNDQLTREGEITQLDPYLPIHSLLTKRILLTRDAIDGAGTDVLCRFDFVDFGSIVLPLEKIGERELDTVFVI